MESFFFSYIYVKGEDEMKRKITRSTSFSLENSWATRNSTETVLTFVLQNNLTKYLSNNGNNIITKLIRHVVIIIKLIVIKKSIYLSNYKLYNIWKTYIDRSSINKNFRKIRNDIKNVCKKGKERKIHEKRKIRTVRDVSWNFRAS